MHFNRAAVSGLTVAANVLFVRVIRLFDVHRLNNLRLRFRLSFCFRFSAPSNQEKYSDNRQEITKPLTGALSKLPVKTAVNYILIKTDFLAAEESGVFDILRTKK